MAWEHVDVKSGKRISGSRRRRSWRRPVTRFTSGWTNCSESTVWTRGLRSGAGVYRGPYERPSLAPSVSHAPDPSHSRRTSVRVSPNHRTRRRIRFQRRRIHRDRLAFQQSFLRQKLQHSPKHPSVGRYPVQPPGPRNRGVVGRLLVQPIADVLAHGQ